MVHKKPPRGRGDTIERVINGGEKESHTTFTVKYFDCRRVGLTIQPRVLKSSELPGLPGLRLWNRVDQLGVCNYSSGPSLSA